MNRYQLAKLVGWAGTLQSRKRMQKVAYLLQAAGCPLDVDYILHHYGPYSEDVAWLTDEMVRVGLLEETAAPSPVGVQYSYCLPETTRRQIEEYERSPQSAKWRDRMAPYEDTAKVLIGADLKVLEIASTVAYFFRQNRDWSLAAVKTRRFKNLPDGSAPLLASAEALARQVVS